MVLESYLLIAAYFLASLITSVTGMAGGILMFAATTAVLPLRTAIAIHGIVQVFSNFWRCWLLRRHIVWSMCWPFLVGAIIGGVLTVLFIAHLVSDQVALGILLALIIYSLFKPKKLPELKLEANQFIGVGLITSSLGLIAGAIDPLLAIFFIRDDLSKEQIVATKSMMQLISHFIKIPAFIYLGFSFMEHLSLLTWLTLSALAGTLLGVLILKRLPQNLFLKLMRVCLMLAGLHIGYQLVS